MQRFKIADCSGSVANTETAADVFHFRMFIYSSPDRHMFSGREPSALRSFTSKTNSLVLTYLHTSASFQLQTFGVLFQPARKITNNLVAVNREIRITIHYCKQESHEHYYHNTCCLSVHSYCTT